MCCCFVIAQRLLLVDLICQFLSHCNVWSVHKLDHIDPDISHNATSLITAVSRQRPVAVHTSAQLHVIINIRQLNKLCCPSHIWHGIKCKQICMSQEVMMSGFAADQTTSRLVRLTSWTGPTVTNTVPVVVFAPL